MTTIHPNRRGLLTLGFASVTAVGLGLGNADAASAHMRHGEGSGRDCAPRRAANSGAQAQYDARPARRARRARRGTSNGRSSTRTTSTRTTSTRTTSTRTSSTRTTGTRNSGTQTAGTRAAGTQTAGTQTAGSNTVTRVTGTGSASLPLKRGTYRRSAGFGATGSWARYHTGQDYSAPTGTPVHAVVSGRVVATTSASWAGIHVAIQAADGSSTMYSHLSRASVRIGQTVQAGQVIGAVGSTGRAFGSHLHFEYYPAGVRPGDVYRAGNPMSYLSRLGLSA